MKHRILLPLLLIVTCGHLCAAVATGQAEEDLDYALLFNWKFVWINAGTANLSTHRTTYQGQKAQKTVLLARSSKTADAIFHLNDTLTSIMTMDMQPLYFTKHSEEGKDDIREYAWFSRTDDGKHRARLKKIYTDGHVREGDYSDTRTIYDMVSLLNYARSFKMDGMHEGQRLTYPMASGRRVEEQILIYKGKQTIEEQNGKRTGCYIFSLVKPQTNSGTSSEAELLRFYISEEADRVPVQIDFFLKFGVAKARLNR